jgi:hypothetical protein
LQVPSTQDWLPRPPALLLVQHTSPRCPQREQVLPKHWLPGWQETSVVTVPKQQLSLVSPHGTQ